MEQKIQVFCPRIPSNWLWIDIPVMTHYETYVDVFKKFMCIEVICRSGTIRVRKDYKLHLCVNKILIFHGNLDV